LYRFVGYRLNNFVVGLTNDDPMTVAPVFKSSYTLCAQYNGSVAPSASATVFCAPSSEKFRFVVVQGSHTTYEAICLIEVAVYARRKFTIALLMRSWTLHLYVNTNRTNPLESTRVESGHL